MNQSLIENSTENVGSLRESEATPSGNVDTKEKKHTSSSNGLDIDILHPELLAFLEEMNVPLGKDLLLIQPKGYYLYSSFELKDIKTIVKNSVLNNFKEPKVFLHNFNRILPDRCYFVGKFIDYRLLEAALKQEKEFVKKKYSQWLFWFEHILVPKIPLLNWLQYIYNGRCHKYLTRGRVIKILKSQGFMVQNIRAVDGVSYFVSQKVKHMKKKKRGHLFTFINELQNPYRIF